MLCSSYLGFDLNDIPLKFLRLLNLLVSAAVMVAVNVVPRLITSMV
jgi:hypothetical protein